MASSSGSADEVADLAKLTLKNVRARFRKLHRDQGVVAAFQFLVALAKCASVGTPQSESYGPAIDLDRNPSILRLVADLNSWVDYQQGSKEYADIAKKASADAITIWSNEQKQQQSLFPEDNDSKGIWQRANSGAGFCEVSRLFFSRFTERYLNYFLEREASAVSANIHLRDEMAAHLREHVDDVSKYAFESARITQSFAAGWFNRHARDSVPSDKEYEGFLYVAFGKMREELMREVSRDG